MYLVTMREEKFSAKVKLAFFIFGFYFNGYEIEFTFSR